MNEECDEEYEQCERDPDLAYDTMRDDMLTEDYEWLVERYGIELVKRYRGEPDED